MIHTIRSFISLFSTVQILYNVIQDLYFTYSLYGCLCLLIEYNFLSGAERLLLKSDMFVL